MPNIELATPVKAKHEIVNYLLCLEDGTTVANLMPASLAEDILNSNEFTIEGDEIFNMTFEEDSEYAHFTFASNDFKLKRATTHKEVDNDKDGVK